MPQESDYKINENDVKRAEKINEDIKNKSYNYSQNNSTVSYVLAYIVICICLGCLIRNYNSYMSDGGLLFISCIGGLFVIFTIGYPLSYFFENIGKEIEPNRVPKKDSEYNRSNAYIIAKNKYDSEMANIKKIYPKIEECDFDLQKYNTYWIDYFRQQMNIMIRNRRLNTLRKITICGDKYFKNLDLIGCEDVRQIRYNLYTAKRKNRNVFITYLSRIQRSDLDDFIKLLKSKNDVKGIIITEESWHEESWFLNLIHANDIELINTNAFEQVVLREINKSNFSIQPNLNSTPFNFIDFQFTDISGYKLYGGGFNYIGFSFQLVTEVFTSKKEIFEKIKNTPKQKGTYGIIRYQEQHSKTIYGLAFFRNSGEIHYFMRYFCAAIDNETKKIANIVTGSSRMRTDCGDYWYQNWSEFCWDD